MITKKLSYLNTGAAAYRGIADRYAKFITNHQLLDRELWNSFVCVFQSDSDDADKGWRGEYWGKMMRGACLIYSYTKDESLYTVLEESVRAMLSTQRSDGRFSTYSKNAELHGWDMWGRKYVLTAMLHFYRICKDQRLKDRIIAAMCLHADAILETVGEGEGKVSIVKTSHIWGGINSCSILDAILDLYRETEMEKYKRFGEYIISTGGCIDGNLLELAEKNQIKPFQYPVVKAYETMSFFEGILTYYEITGESRYLKIVQNFVEAVCETDLTVIGCCGCKSEEFDHAALTQVEENRGIMQETCVTVTWMRLMARLFLITGEEKYFACVEQSAYNALYGSVNTNRLKQYSSITGKLMDPLPFDSYGVLCNGSRGLEIGGFKQFSFGGFYGCCACIASAGLALLPLCAVMKSDKGFVVNGFLEGVIKDVTPSGQAFLMEAESVYPKQLDWKAVVRVELPEAFELRVRIPAFSRTLPEVTVNGHRIADLRVEKGYVILQRVWSAGDRVCFRAEYGLEMVQVGKRKAFVYGPLVLAADAYKENIDRDLMEIISIKSIDGQIQYSIKEESGQEYEMIRLNVERSDQKEPLLLTDYASCGKHWLEQHKKMTVWMNVQ